MKAKTAKTRKMTRAEVLRRVRGLEREERNAVVCALVGHSGIHHSCWGYKNCARCGAQVGDSLGGSYDGSSTVIVGHNCKKCRTNYAAMTWRDKLFVPDPFKAATVKKAA